MGLFDDFSRGLGVLGSAIGGNTAPLQGAAENTVHNFNRGIRVLGDNAPGNIANVASNFAGDFNRGLGVVADNPAVLPGAIAGAAGDMAWHPVASAQHLGESIGHAIKGDGAWDDALMAAPDFAASALGAGQLASGGVGMLGRSGAALPESRLARHVASDAVRGVPITRAAAANPAVNALLDSGHTVAEDALFPNLARAVENRAPYLPEPPAASPAVPSPSMPTPAPTAPAPSRLLGALDRLPPSAESAAAPSILKPNAATSTQWPGAGTQFGDDLSFVGRDGRTYRVSGNDIAGQPDFFNAHAIDPQTGQQVSAAAFQRLPDGRYVADTMSTPEAMQGRGIMHGIYDAVQREYGPIYQSTNQTPSGAEFWTKALARAAGPPEPLAQQIMGLNRSLAGIAPSEGMAARAQLEALYGQLGHATGGTSKANALLNAMGR